jgi:hypothetical protein
MPLVAPQSVAEGVDQPQDTGYKADGHAIDSETRLVRAFISSCSPSEPARAGVVREFERRTPKLKWWGDPTCLDRSLGIY